MRNLILCGFMGCGKTTVGHYLAKLLSMEYIDLDAELEETAGMSIPELFSRFGEPYFRDLEHEAVAALTKRIGCVVSTGGGAMTFARNVKAVAPQDTVIFLDTPFDLCYDRIMDTDRPIVRSSTPEQLRALYEQRRISYLAAATFPVDGTLSVEEAAQAIIANLQSRHNA